MKVKQNITLINVARLERLIETFSKIPSEHVCMVTVISAGPAIAETDIATVLQKIVAGKQRGCGTTCCLYGAFPLAFPRSFRYDTTRAYYMTPVTPIVGKGSRTMSACAAAFLGGDRQWWDQLFHSYHYTKSDVLKRLKTALKKTKAGELVRYRPPLLIP